MKTYMKWPLLSAALLALVLAAGCASGNAIKLQYALISTDAPCAGEITVFRFEDQRPASTLGKTTDNETITSLSDVAEWVGWALFDELQNAGCKPKYRTAITAPDDELVVTGQVLELTLNQTGVTTYKGRVSVRIVVSRGDTTLHAEKYTSEVEDVVVPGYSSESDILAEALRGVMYEAIPAIAQASRK